MTNKSCDDCALTKATSHDPARRDFVTAMLMAGVSTYLAACGDNIIGGPLGPGNPTLPAALVVNVSDFPALGTIGGTARVDPNTSKPVAVHRTGASTFIALSMICTHQRYKPINIEPFGFECPNHGAQFSPTGNWLAGQRTRDLVQYAITFDGVDTLTIT
jgi:cytochrome b6-f complex iron-sulfur subunit